MNSTGPKAMKPLKEVNTSDVEKDKKLNEQNLMVRQTKASKSSQAYNICSAS